MATEITENLQTPTAAAAAIEIQRLSTTHANSHVMVPQALVANSQVAVPQLLDANSQVLVPHPFDDNSQVAVPLPLDANSQVAVPHPLDANSQVSVPHPSDANSQVAVLHPVDANSQVTVLPSPMFDPDDGPPQYVSRSATPSLEGESRDDSSDEEQLQLVPPQSLGKFLGG